MPSKNVLLEQVESLTKTALDEHSAELVDLQFVHEHGQWILRYFVDTAGGITLDECADISEHVGRLLDATDVIPQSYSLEVSSPGLNRPLRKIKDFSKYLGERVDVTLFAPVSGRRHFRGTLQSVHETSITVLDYEQKECELTVADIAKAKLDPDIKI